MIAHSNQAGDSSPSDTASALTAPAAPTGLQAAATTTLAINLNWTDHSTTETGYEIQSSLDGTTFSPWATTAPHAQHYTATGLTPETTYYFRVRAVRGSVVSGFSNVGSVTTPSANEEDLGEVTPQITADTMASFGNFAAGTYRVEYVSGLMYYNPDLLYVNFRPGNQFMVSYAGGPEEQAPSAAFVHTGGTIGVHLVDYNDGVPMYSDNTDGPNGNPTFRLVRLSSPAVPMRLNQ